MRPLVLRSVLDSDVKAIVLAERLLEILPMPGCLCQRLLLLPLSLHQHFMLDFLPVPKDMYADKDVRR